MSSLLRTVKYQRWAPKEWLLKGELQAAALKDVSTADSGLSVYLTDAGIGIDRMAAAIAATGTSVAQVDYVLLDINWLEAQGFKVANTPDHGLTPDCDVNELHHDIQSLTYPSCTILRSTCRQ